MSKGNPELKYYLFGAFFAAIVLVIVLFLIVVWVTSPAFFTDYILSQKGGLGDAINGITAPFIGVSVAILTFLAFYMQFKANETHNRQFNEQSLEKEREKHENKILYLIKKNRNIAVNMNIGESIKGAKCFTKMFNEYREAYKITNSFYADDIKEGALNNKDIINISYLIFYNGVGETSNILNDSILKNAPRLTVLLSIFHSAATASENGAETLKKHYHVDFDHKILSDLNYKPFDGHTTRLGQYFRNLFHILSYTYNIPVELISKLENYELIKSLRSQLSSYEQILIYFNSLSLYGKPLEDNGFIEQYHLIKNIPLPLIEFSGDIHDYYNEIDFEWDEIIERANTN